MTTSRARAITYSVVALLAAAALRYTQPVAEPTPPDVLTAVPAPLVALVRHERVDTLGHGESLRALLERGGISSSAADSVLRAATTLDERRIPAGMPVTIASASVDSQPSEVTLRPTIDRLVRLRRTAAGWVGAEELLPWSIDTAVVTGVIHSTLYEAFDAAAPTLPRAARSELVWTLADIFEYRVDMSRDLQDGDAFRVLYERATAPNGLVKVDKILAATFDLSGSRVEAIRYESRGGAGHYFDGEGKSLQAAFLRAPLEFRRISSVFGMRKHPILGVWKQHKGTDYAAAQGTPVRAIGDGVVIFAGQKHGYGNVLDIRHRNGFVSRYGHLHGFAAGVHTGTHVAIGRTVAYVGMTGLATAPHLHFEVLVGGVQHDPKIALRMKDGLPIPGGERDSFERTRTLLLASLDAGDSHNRLAMR